MLLHDAGSHAISAIIAPAEESVDDIGEGEATGDPHVSSVTTNIGVSLRVSPDQPGVGVLRYERLQGEPGHPTLLVEGVVTQPACLGSSSEGGVTVLLHDVPGLQELHCNNNIYYQDSNIRVNNPPDQY